MEYAMFALLVAVVSVALATDYDIEVATADIEGADTNANVYIKIIGKTGTTSKILLDYSGRNDFERGAVDLFEYSAEDVGTVTGFEVMRDNTQSYGVNPDWAFDSIGVKIATDSDYMSYHFGYWLPADKWLKFPRPRCGDVGHTCYFKNDLCPSGTEECVEYECSRDTNKCCCNGVQIVECREKLSKWKKDAWNRLNAV